MVCQSCKSLPQEDEKDDYGHTVRASHESIQGHFLEKINSSTGHHFKLSKKLFLYKESVVYPFVHSLKQRKYFRYQTLILSRSYSMKKRKRQDYLHYNAKH